MSSNGEVAEIARRVRRQGGPALLFESVDDRAASVLASPFAASERLALGLGVTSFDSLTDRVAGLFQLLQNALAGGVTDRLRLFGEMSQLGRLAPRIVDRAPVRDIRQPSPSLSALPFVDGDGTGTRAISLALVMRKDPISEESWAETTSGRIVDDRRIAFTLRHPQSAEMLRRSLCTHDSTEPRSASESRCPAAIALGLDPSSLLAHIVRFPAHLDPWTIAGVIRQAPIDLTRGASNNLAVPAHAEVVLEGYFEAHDPTPDPASRKTERVEPDHVFYCTAVSHRRDPIIVATTGAGASDDERSFMRAIEHLLLPLARSLQPDIVDLCFPLETDISSVVFVSVRRRSVKSASSILASIFGFVSTETANVVVLFDEDVDLRDPAICASWMVRNVDWHRDVSILHDRNSRGTGGPPRIGINATSIEQTPLSRATPPNQHIDRDALAALVDQKWASYGIPL